MEIKEVTSRWVDNEREQNKQHKDWAINLKKIIK